MKTKLPIIAIIVVVGLLCCCLVVAGVYIAKIGFSSYLETPRFEVTLDIPRPRITGLPFPSGNDAATPSPTPIIVNQPVDPEQFNSLKVLEEMVVPVNDPRELAMRLGGKGEIPLTVDSPIPSAVGEQRQFWVQNVDTNQNFQIHATLRYIGEHIYFWIQDGISYQDKDLQQLAQTFDTKIYPTDREFFGSEWNPGIDNDPRLYILFARGLGYNLAGYFSSADSVHPLAHKYSNGHEMFLLNADNLSLGEEFTYSVLAHEFQHMIHWYRDRNESSWLNEGFSELAAFLNQYSVGGFDFLFAQDPDLQLNDWPNDPNATAPHYGAGFLFVTYFLDRFGEEATQALVGNPENGMDSVDAVLKELQETDPLTGEQLSADDVFADWVVANYLHDGSLDGGRYYYHNYASAPQVRDTEQIKRCPQDWQSRDVAQYGADYIKISCSGQITLNFEGSSQVGVLPENPHSGDYAFWSNKGDESDMTLTRSFDFSQVEGPLTLNYYTWYDLEKDYDYLYLVASEDGEHWQILKTPSGTDQDPSGNSYGWGYNGVSNGWIQESVDLSQFAGKQVMLRFEYVTDAAVNGEGLLLDDVSVPEIGYQTDFETDDGGWEGAGFVRIQNALPQTFRLALIRRGKQTTVETINVQAGQKVSLPMQMGGNNSTREVILVVSGTTRFTRQMADYHFSIE